MNKGHIFTTNTELELPESLNIGCGFNVANGSAEFDNAGIGFAITAVSWTSGNIFDPILDSVGDMGNHLNRFAKVISPSLGFNDIRVDFTRCEIVVF